MKIEKLISEIKFAGILKAHGKLEELYDLAVSIERERDQLQDHVNALAAENGVMKQGIADITFMRDEDFFGSTPEAQKVMGRLVNTKTPSTDAFIAEIKAQGVESFGDELELGSGNLANLLKVCAYDFAANLRAAPDAEDGV